MMVDGPRQTMFNGMAEPRAMLSIFFRESNGPFATSAIVLSVATLFALQLCFAPLAHAQTLEVRGTSHIELSAEERVLTVSLRDDRDAPIVHTRFELGIDDQATRILVTNADGDAQLELEGDGPWEVFASFEGDGPLQGRSVDRTVRALDRVELELPGDTIALDGGPIAASATAEPGPLLTYTIRNELDREVATASAHGGRVDWELNPGDLGNPGVGVLELSVSDASGIIGQDRVAIVRTLSPTLTLVAERLEVDSEKSGKEDELTLRLSGTLVAGERPMVQRVLRVFVASEGEQRAGSESIQGSAGDSDTALERSSPTNFGTFVGVVETGENGVFSWVGTVPNEAGRAVVRFESRAPGIRSVAAVAELPSPPASFENVTTWVICLFAVLLLGAALLRRESTSPAVESVDVPPLVLGERTQRRPTKTRVSGVVTDRHGEHVAASVRFLLSEPEEPILKMDLDAEGAFSFEAPRALDKSGMLLIEAPDHMPERITISIPHHGEYEGLRVRLSNIRDHVAAVVSRHVPVAKQKGLPPTIHDRTRHPVLGRVAERGERAVYAASAPSVDEAQAIENALVIGNEETAKLKNP